METSLLRCVRCGAALQAEEAAYRCQECACVYPVRLGVPLFVPDVQIEPSGFDLTPELASRACQGSGVPDDAEAHQSLREIFAHNYRLADLGLTAENNYFLQRIRVSSAARQEAPPAAVPPHRDDARLTVQRHYLPDSLPLNQTASWNMRLVNSGTSWLLAQGEGASFLVSRWRDKRGQLVAGSRERTTLPTNLAPGRALTLPVWLATPAVPGAFELELILTREGVRPSEQIVCMLPVQLRRDWESEVPLSWKFLQRDPSTYDYAADHEIGRGFFKEELPKQRNAVERVLEVGGCCNPMCWDVSAEVVSIDIDVQTLQVGQLRCSRTLPHIQFACADAAHLPYVAGAFDCAVMFATLHHLVDPVHCLHELRRVVREDGFIAILCEPVGSYRAETLAAGFRDELEQGINEQIFTAEEYARIFRKAGLSASRAVIDGGSFKVILRRATRPTLLQRFTERGIVRSLRKLSRRLRSLGGRVKRRLSRVVKAS